MEFSVWEKRAVTGLICGSFIVGLGIGCNLPGPMLLDLVDVYGTSVNMMSAVFVVSCVGGILGSFAVGYLTDRFQRTTLLQMFAYTFVLTATLPLYPHCGYLAVFFVMNLVMGFANSALNSGGNVLCLNLWRGQEGSPYMHSIHFSYALGAVLAPLTAAPFLSHQPSYVRREEGRNGSSAATWVFLEDKGEDPSQIQIPFFIAGGAMMAVASGFLYFGVAACRRNAAGYRAEPLDDDDAIQDDEDQEEEQQQREEQQVEVPQESETEETSDAQEEEEGQQADDNERSLLVVSQPPEVGDDDREDVAFAPDDRQQAQEQEQQQQQQHQPFSLNRTITIALFSLFCFTYVGIESTYGTYLTAFSVHCRLHLSKAEGAYITSIYWGSFAAMRFLAIWASIRLNPLVIMLLSFALCLVSSIALLIYAESSLWVLRIASGVFGFGNASVFATGLLWLEQYFEITGLIGALVTIATSVGPNFTTLIIGQFIVDKPMSLMYLAVVIVVATMLIFAVMSIFAARAKRDLQRQREGEGSSTSQA